VLVPKGSGSTQFGMNANLHWLTAQWVPAAGIGFGLAPTIELYQRVRLRIFDLGVFYNYKNPLTVPDISRKLDLTLATGLDIRVWKGIALHAQVGWFLPNPSVSTTPARPSTTRRRRRTAMTSGRRSVR